MIYNKVEKLCSTLFVQNVENVPYLKRIKVKDPLFTVTRIALNFLFVTLPSSPFPWAHPPTVLLEF